MENDNSVPVVEPERDIRVTTRDVAEYYKISVDQVRALFREGIFQSTPKYIPGKRGYFRPLYSEVRALETHRRVLEMKARHARTKKGSERGGRLAQVLKRLCDVEALQREQQRMLATLGVTVLYQDRAHPPEDAVGERGGRPGDTCPGYKDAKSCGGKLLLRWSDENGWFLGCMGHRHDGNGCHFCETIVRSKASAVAHEKEVVPVPAPDLTSSWPEGEMQG